MGRVVVKAAVLAVRGRAIDLARFKRAVFAMCILLSGCEYFPESEFTLSSHSRLPRWFRLPEGVPRDDLSVKASLYVDHATFVLTNERTGTRIAKVRGQILNNHGSIIVPAARMPNGVDPNFDVASANGIVEIMVYKIPEPEFEMLDDPKLRAIVLSAIDSKDLPR